MTRQDELNKIMSHADADALKLLTPLIEHVVFLEDRLNELKGLPFIIVHPDDNRKQKVTVAYKQYKDLSQTYINALKVINGALGIDGSDETSPLRAYLESRGQK